MTVRAVVGLALGACLHFGCASGARGPIIFSDFHAARGPALHMGIDFRERMGAPVIAAADGVVVHASPPEVWAGGCGLGVTLEHRFSGSSALYTTYCHLDPATVKTGDAVRRGQMIGRVGVTGFAGGIPHVHFELCTFACTRGHADGNSTGVLNPWSYFVGCFEDGPTYPDEKLTFPVRCK